MGQISKVFGVDVDERQTVADSKRRSGYSAEQVDNRDLNEILFKTRFDHIIGSQAQVVAVNATCYYDSTTTSFKDKNGSTVTFSDGDRILWAGLDAITADIDLSTIDELEHTTDTGVTIALGSQNLALGSDQRGTLNLSGTGTVSASSAIYLKIIWNGDDILHNSGIVPKAANLSVDITSQTQAGIRSDELILISPNGESIEINNFNVIVDITNDIHNSATEKNAAWYDVHVKSDYAGNTVQTLFPKIVGTADGTTSSKLVDSTADFVSDGVRIGDTIYNTDDFTKTTVTAIDDLNTLSLNDDFFVSGENYEIIMTPDQDTTYAFSGKVASIYNNSSGHLEKKIKYIDTELYAVVSDTKTASTAGGSSTGGTENTRDINTIETNLVGCFIGSNQIFIPDGVYSVEGSAPSYRGGEHQLTMYNVSDSSYEIIGTSEYGSTADNVVQTRSFLNKIIHITDPKIFDFRHYINTTKTTNGLGRVSGSGREEIYAIIKIKKIG